jgi:hypothetical protein
MNLPSQVLQAKSCHTRKQTSALRPFAIPQREINALQCWWKSSYVLHVGHYVRQFPVLVSENYGGRSVRNKNQNQNDEKMAGKMAASVNTSVNSI